MYQSGKNERKDQDLYQKIQINLLETIKLVEMKCANDNYVSTSF